MQLKNVLDAYGERDIARARDVWANDFQIDALEDSVFRDLLTFMMEDPRNITFCTHLLFCSKNIERIGDHSTNIAETVVYLVTGETLPTRPTSQIAVARRRDVMNVDTEFPVLQKRDGASAAPRVLVVEDEEALALVLTYNLEAEGLSGGARRPRRRGRGAAARSHARSHHPRLDVAGRRVRG